MSVVSVDFWKVATTAGGWSEQRNGLLGARDQLAALDGSGFTPRVGPVAGGFAESWALTASRIAGRCEQQAVGLVDGAQTIAATDGGVRGWFDAHLVDLFSGVAG